MILSSHPTIHYVFAAAPCRSMLLSTFSHYSFFHIFANMYVLHSFSNGICHALGKEQTLFVYVTAGLCASYASYIHKVFLGVSGASLGAVSFGRICRPLMNANGHFSLFIAHSFVSVFQLINLLFCRFFPSRAPF